LYHFAILYPHRSELAKAFKRLLEVHYPVQVTVDHGVSEAVDVADPDGNGVELSADRPPEAWPRDAQGTLTMGGRAVDVSDLVAELEREAR
jgi:catechol 2,3-dioxygenase